MWTKFLAVLAVMLFVVAGWYLMRQNDQIENKQGDTADRQTPALKEARNIVMFEKRLDSGKIFVIHARMAQENMNEKYTLKDFRVEKSDGLKIEGSLAKYDAEASVLKVVGPMTIYTKDGWKASVTDLVWNRTQKYAVTEKPVSVKGGKGWLRGNRAEFFDDFNEIQITGDVHAQFAQSALDS